MSTLNRVKHVNSVNHVVNSVNHVNSVNRVDSSRHFNSVYSVNSVNRVNSVTSLCAVLPPALMVFFVYMHVSAYLDKYYKLEGKVQITHQIIRPGALSALKKQLWFSD